MKWDYEGDFLDAFEQRWRGTIGDQVCRVIREGVTDTGEILERMQKKCLANISDHNGAFYAQLYAALGTQEARNFVGHLVWRESLTWEEKCRLKEEAKTQNAKNFMATQPPTDKQLSYLKTLGCADVPKTKLEASEMIDAFVRRRAA